MVLCITPQEPELVEPVVAATLETQRTDKARMELLTLEAVVVVQSVVVEQKPVEMVEKVLS